MKKIFINLFFLIIFSGQIFAIGELDLGFNSTGRVFTSFGHLNIFLHDTAVQPDGKIIFARRFGTFPDWTFVTSRILATGENDSQFGASGSSSSASGVNALQPDGKLVVGAIEMESFAVSRLTGDSPIPSQAEISGRLVNQNARGIGGAMIEITDPGNGWSKFVSVNSFGFFRFDNLPTNKIYKLKIISKRFKFPEHSFHLTDDLKNLELAPDFN